jgi:tetratricopeptide (TPR) repeat protein
VNYDFDQEKKSTWLSRLLHITLVVGLLALIGVRVYGYFASSQSEENAEPRKAKAERSGDLVRKAEKAFTDRRWPEAIEHYGEMVQRYPQNVQAWYRYALSLHQNGDLEEAHNAWMRLCSFRQARRIALYNIACIYALQGEKQLALDYLQEAIDAGFERRQSISEDPDLVSLVDDAEFKRLEELAKPIGMRNTYRRFDFLQGKWLLTTPGGRRVGSLVVTPDNNGYTLLGRLINNSSSNNTTIVSFFEPGVGRWKQVWVDDRGTVIQLEHAEGEEDSLVLEGEMVTSEGETRRARVIYTEDEEGVVSQTLLNSRDGEDWDPLLAVELVSREPLKKSLLDIPPTR